MSSFRCVERLLDNWDALKVYFKAQKDQQDAKKKPTVTKASSKDSGIPKAGTKLHTGNGKASAHSGNSKTSSNSSSSKVVFEKVYMEPSYAEKKVETILSFVRSPTNKLYVLFLSYTLKVYEEILTCLQAEDPKIHILRRSLQKLLRSLLVRFVKPSAIAATPLDQVNYHAKYNIKHNSELVIGESAKGFIQRKAEHHLKDRRIEEFYHNVVCYFQVACDYIKKKLPLNEPVLRHAEVADVALQQLAMSSSLLFFIERFPCLLPKNVTKDRVIEQFAAYQSTDLKTAVGEKVLNDRMDEQWKQIGLLTDENGNTLFHELSEVMLAVLTIPHSSAHCERVFSTVRKNRTDQRSSLSDDTLQTLLTLKSRAGDFLEKEYSSQQLTKLKSAYYRSLSE